jgi:aspartate/methionine/tyrosine aminotransferase
MARSLASRLSGRAQVLASAAGAAAPLWEKLNALASRPGMINMSQGMPDFAGSTIARRVAAAALEAGDAPLNQYSPQPGLIDLRQAVSEFVARRYGAAYDPATEVAITAGGQEALAALFLAFCDPGDEVIVFEPFYPFMLGAIHQVCWPAHANRQPCHTQASPPPTRRAPCRA